jgi:hypothetical protein
MVRRALGIFFMAVLVAGCTDDDDDTPRPTPTSTQPTATATGLPATVTATSTVPATPVPTSTAPAPTASSTAVPTLTPSVTHTVSSTPTITATPTPTATPRRPEIVAFGVARADDLVQAPAGVDGAGRPVFVRAQGQGMTLYIEGQRGSVPIDGSTYDSSGALLPGVELLVSRPLGDGSRAVCDYDPPRIGGIPGVDPPVFGEATETRDAIDDLGCRFNDGTGLPRGRTATSACTRDVGALYDFTNPESEIQFCLPVAKAWAFPPGDTIVAARVRDVRGQVSQVQEIVVRVEGSEPFDCMGGLGERVFTPDRPASQLVIDGEGDVSVDDWIADPLHICAGPDIGNGVHVLALREDARFGIPLIDGSTLCTKILARGSFGVVDCDGGSPVDVLAVAEQENGRISLDIGLGLPAGTGAATLRMPTAYLVLPVGSTPSDCFGAQFGGEVPGAMTTALGTAEVRDAEGTAVASISRTGQPFSCSAWRDGGSPVFVLPIPAAGTPQSGDVASALILVD